jgi:hypothetical protein
MQMSEEELAADVDAPEEERTTGPEESTTDIEAKGSIEEPEGDGAGAEPAAKEKSAEQKRIDKLTWEKYQARRDEKAVSERLEQVLAEKGGPDNEAVMALVRQEAERMASDQSFNDVCNKVYAKGTAAFKDFDNAVEALQVVGVDREFLEIVVDSDIAPKLLHYLGNNLDEADRINMLPPIQKARALTKLEYEINSKPVSSAPEPIKHLNGNRSAVKKTLDTPGLTQAEFNKIRAEQIAQRNKW